jgi:hypothetical protein
MLDKPMPVKLTAATVMANTSPGRIVACLALLVTAIEGTIDRPHSGP